MIDVKIQYQVVDTPNKSFRDEVKTEEIKKKGMQDSNYVLGELFGIIRNRVNCWVGKNGLAPLSEYSVEGVCEGYRYRVNLTIEKELENELRSKLV